MGIGSRMILFTILLFQQVEAEIAYQEDCDE
jgi:hypothetical protein